MRAHGVGPERRHGRSVRDIVRRRQRAPPFVQPVLELCRLHFLVDERRNVARAEIGKGDDGARRPLRQQWTDFRARVRRDRSARPDRAPRDASRRRLQDAPESPGRRAEIAKRRPADGENGLASPMRAKATSKRSRGSAEIIASVVSIATRQRSADQARRCATRVLPCAGARGAASEAQTAARTLRRSAARAPRHRSRSSRSA